MNVLVVEDDISAASMLTRLIQGWGYHVDTSETGKETLEKVGKEIFDLVLLDVFLPDTTALDLIPRIKELQPGLGIVTMTGYNTEILEKEIRAKGIIYYMSKPFNANEVKEILDHISNKNGIHPGHGQDGRRGQDPA